MNINLFPMHDLASLPAVPEAPEPPRLRKPDRRQITLRPVCLDETLPPEHEVRTLWALVEGLDLTAFEQDLKARGSAVGRAATDTRILVALWLWAATQGIGSARQVDRLCEQDDVFRWICGGVSMNYHTLSDFRVGHREALDALLTQVLSILMHEGIVHVKRISQDGTRIRASAGASSFRRKATLDRCLAEAQQQVEALGRQAEAPVAQECTARQQAAKARAARERLARVQKALNRLPEVEAIKARQGKAHDPKHPARVSTTDPEAQVMKMGDGGFRPAYNVQLAQDTQSRAILAVEVSTAGSDQGLDEPLREQVEKRTGGKVQEHLVDGGYTKHEAVEDATVQGVALYGPPMKSKAQPDPYLPREGDSPEVIQWRLRMGTPEAQEIYKLRAATSETCNADLKCHRGLQPFRVRGLSKVLAVTLWSVLAYNLMHFGAAVLAALQKG
jgi:transposase